MHLEILYSNFFLKFDIIPTVRLQRSPNVKDRRASFANGLRIIFTLTSKGHLQVWLSVNVNLTLGQCQRFQTVSCYISYDLSWWYNSVYTTLCILLIKRRLPQEKPMLRPKRHLYYITKRYSVFFTYEFWDFYAS